MESGVAEFVMAKCDLSIIFEAVIAEHEALIKKKDLNLIYNKPDFPTEIICNQGKITQVVANLMGNAIKFTPSGKNITLSAKRDDQATYISISDEGVGVPEEQIEDIFKKFVQSTRTKTQAGGTGLGLTICMGIVNGHKGKIWAENNKDKGSTFTFTIPLNLGEGTITVKPNIL
jgi:two-component system sensor histidine kinase ChiS